MSKTLYLVEMHLDEAAMKVRGCERVRRDAALLQLHQFAYDSLEAFGKLDTPAAHEVVQKVNNVPRMIAGDEIRIPVSNTGRTVVIRRAA